MRYFVHIKLNEAVLSEEAEGFSELYDACARAAEIASEGIIKYSNGAGDGTAGKRLAVEIVDSEGNLKMRIPINRARMSRPGLVIEVACVGLEAALVEIDS